MSLYDLFNIISGLALLFFNFSQIKKKKVLLGNTSNRLIRHCKGDITQTIFTRFLSGATFWAIMELLIISVIQYLPAPIINKNFGNLVGTGANYFGLLYIVPFLLLVICLLLQVDPLIQIDMVTPGFPFALFFAKLGCFTAGCCNGIACSFGFPNPSTGIIEFPIQLMEAGVAMLLFFFFLFWRTKAKRGTMFPTYLIVYSGVRFFTEFLRADENVFGFLKTYQILCLIGILLGIIELIVVSKLGAKISESCCSSISA